MWIPSPGRLRYNGVVPTKPGKTRSKPYGNDPPPPFAPSAEPSAGPSLPPAALALDPHPHPRAAIRVLGRDRRARRSLQPDRNQRRARGGGTGARDRHLPPDGLDGGGHP